MEPAVKRAICTELIKVVHRCIQGECPRFSECLSYLSICIYRQPREVVRDAWEVWQFILHARELAGEDAFLETREPFNEKQLREILEECREDLCCEIEYIDDKVKFIIR